MSDSWLKRSIVLRMLLIGGLSLALLVPSLMITGLISDREHTRNAAVLEMNEKWGQAQTISGPILTLPYKKPSRTEQGEIRYVTGYAHILPESLAIVSTTTPEVRYRGIHRTVLYSAKLGLRGRFSLDNLAALNVKAEDVLWSQATLVTGITDLKGIKETVLLNWDGNVLAAEPGTANSQALSTGINVRPPMSMEKKEYTFSADIILNGSGDLQFVPVGKTTVVRVTSTWGSPSFVGRFLPEKRVVQADGFTAEWQVLHVNRNFPQQWTGGECKLDGSSFGVKFLLPVDEYQKTTRSAKYAIMFIALTFLAFFLTEVLNRKVVHPIQYALIGFALVLFYCLLLSLSEHMTFNIAYLISCIAIVGLVAGYARAVLSSTRMTLMIAGVLSLLYGFLFVILQQEDYALLFGSFGLLAILALVMYLTRKIDWFAVGKVEPGAG